MTAPQTEKFLIVAAPRTGSTMLGTMLNSRPGVICGGEVLNNVWIAEGGRIDWARKSRYAEELERDERIHRLRRDDPMAFLEELHRLAIAEGYRVFGFKMLYAHAFHAAAVSLQLAHYQGLRAVHVMRRDRLRRYLSLQRALRSGAWSSTAITEPAADPGPLELDWDDMVRDFAETERNEQEVRRVFGLRPMLELYYEDMLADPQATERALQEFLGLDARPLQPSTRRQGGDRLRDAIANYDALAERAVGTRWAGLFEE